MRRIDTMAAKPLPFLVVSVLSVSIGLVGGSVGHALNDLTERPSLPAPPTVIDLRAPQPASCPPVQVTCECPSYEQGWDDAEYARGEIEDDYCSPENLKQVCADFIEYGPEDFAEFSEPDC